MKKQQFFITVFFLVWLTYAKAQWSTSPMVNSAISLNNAAGDPNIISDGIGGAIITWRDSRSGNYDIYAQRISASGVIQWTNNGVAICNVGYNQVSPKIVSDNSGGAIITWMDIRNGSDWDIYAQRINASGVVQWNTNGIVVCSATDDQYFPRLISDGSEGAIITWGDYRSGTWDIYTQRINASGIVQWIIDGVALCNALGGQFYPVIVSDNAGGAIVTWEDERVTTGADIYAQHIDAMGVVQWLVDGVSVCNSIGYEADPTISTDGMGGAIIAWNDYRPGTNQQIYAQRINATGVAQWITNGIQCSDTGYMYYPKIVSDGMGGAIITWHQIMNISDHDVYAQNINSTGVVQWPANGVVICSAIGIQRNPTIIYDSNGGTIIAWYDNRTGIDFDIYIQKINAAGVVQWPTDGVALCTALNDQTQNNIISDGSGGAIVAWFDLRNAGDIYAQNICSSGILGCTSSVSEQTDKNELSLYPNPSRGTITIHSVKEGDYSIYNEMGQTIQSINLNNSNNFTTTINNFKNGIYFIAGINNNSPVYQKAVVIK